MKSFLEPQINSGFVGNDDLLVLEGAKALGLNVQPFLHVEASADDFLSRYLVDFDIPPSTWHTGNTIFSAPPGGGKTALKIFSTMACWEQLGHQHPLPVSLILDTASEEMYDTNVGDTIPQQIAKAVSTSLLLAILYQPNRLLQLPVHQQHEIFNMVDQVLPMSLLFYGMQLDSIQSLQRITFALDRSYRPPGRPEHAAIEELSLAITTWGANENRKLKPNDWNDFLKDLTSVIQSALGFGGLLFLLDGFDNSKSLIENPDYSIRWLDSVVISLYQMARTNIKAFLPQNFVDLLQQSDAPFPVITITWTELRLHDLLRRRILAASSDSFGSLDAIADIPDCSVEAWIIGHSDSRPRAVIEWVRRILAAVGLSYIQLGAVSALTVEHLEAAKMSFGGMALLGNR